MTLITPSRVSALALTLFLFCIAGGLALILTYQPENSDPFRADAIHDAPFTALTYSVQIFAWWDTSITAGLHMDWTRLLGFTHAKQGFAWGDIEPERGVFDWVIADRVVALAESRDVALVARLDNTPDWAHSSLPPQKSADYVDAPPDDLRDYATFCGAVAGRYAGRIHAYQVWNEPNLTREWGNRPPDAAEYVALLAACADAIHAADPHAVVISAGLAPTGNLDETAIRDDVFLQRMYDLGFQRYVEAVGVHAPGWGIAPEISPNEAEAEGRGRWASFRHVEDLRQIMVANGDAAHQIAILEIGYTTDQSNPAYQWHAVTEQQQREYLVRAFAYAAEHWRPWVGLMNVIYLADPRWTPEDEQYWWALNDADGIRPAFAGLAQMEKICGDAVLPARDEWESAFAPEHNPCD